MATHRFEPTIYYTAMGTYPPVLQIASGDSVETTTVDARGQDAELRQASPERGNPQTGPFFVEGAEPGDTLAVHFDKLRPNRRLGWTRAVLAANVVDPNYVAKLVVDDRLAEWDVDVDTWTATLTSPETSLGRFTVPLAPMLGC